MTGTGSHTPQPPAADAGAGAAAQLALITGGSSGIGLALSRRLAAAGWRLRWVARDAGELRTAAQWLASDLGAAPDLAHLACDLATPSAPAEVHHWLHTQGEIPDLLVNNAGVGYYGPLAGAGEDHDAAMLAVNIGALHGITRRFLPAMLARGSGIIVNLASIAGIVAMPGFGLYSGTKAFVRHYTRCLDLELRALGSGVRAIAVCPAAVRDTAFQRAAGMEHTGFFRDPLATSADEVARDIHRALATGRRQVVTGRRLRVLLPLIRLLPDHLLLRLRYRREFERHQLLGAGSRGAAARRRSGGRR